ncbi:MAG: DMT family transporter [Rudaea sp.]|nr:DMT family transporter [Rudaea sp.]
MSAGAALISTTSIFVRWAHVAPTVSAFYRMLFGGVMLLVLLLVRREWRRFGFRDLVWLLLPALAFAADLIIWHRSILYIGPGLATLVANFQVFIMAFVGVVFYRERLGPRFVFGLVLALVGLWLLVGVDWSSFTPQFRIGVYLGLLTGVAYSVYLLSLRRVQLRRVHLDATQVLCLNSLLCVPMLAIAVGIEGGSYAIPDTQSWLALLGLGLFGQVLGWVLIVRAMPQLPASLVGLLLLLQPALSFVLDVILFARPTSGLDWIGLTLSLLGIFVGSVRARPSAAAESA